MLQEKYAKLDDLAAPNCYVAPPTSEDLSYVVHFRQICKRYNIDFSSADSDEKNFVMKRTSHTFRLNGLVSIFKRLRRSYCSVHDAVT